MSWKVKEDVDCYLLGSLETWERCEALGSDELGSDSPWEGRLPLAYLPTLHLGTLGLRVGVGVTVQL